MDAQQLYNHIIKPTHIYMGGNYHSKNASMQSLATAAIESKCGHYIKQIGGPALGIWQMEPDTAQDIWLNCDALKGELQNVVELFMLRAHWRNNLVESPVYACAMARLKYSMDRAPLPPHDDLEAIYAYYKRIYNTPLGASTLIKFKRAWHDCGLDKVVL